MTTLRKVSVVRPYLLSETPLGRGGPFGAVASINKLCYPASVFLRKGLASTSKTGALPQKSRFVAFGPTAYCEEMMTLKAGISQVRTFDDFSAYYEDFLNGTYDCIGGIVLNAYFIMAQSNGGFRAWWRRLAGGDDSLDNMQLMRFAERFARRVRACANMNRILPIHCQRGHRQHEIAEQYLPKDATLRGLLCILAGRAPGA